MKNLLFYLPKGRKLAFIVIILINACLCSVISCNNYENPGNNTGKTGDGTTSDSLQAKKNDTGKGANLENKMINEQNDSAAKKRQHLLNK